MEIGLCKRTAEIVGKAAARAVAMWFPAEKRREPLTGLPEFLTWISNLELELRSYQEPTAETIATKNWLQLARDVATLSDLAQEVRDGKRPATEFGQAMHIEGALQRVVYASLRGFLAAKLGTQTVPASLEKIAVAQERLNEVVQQHTERNKIRARPATVTHEVILRVRPTLELAVADLKRQ